MIQQRYLRPAGQGLLRTRALARVVALRAIASAKDRLLTAGWLPSGSAETLRVSTRSVREGLQACAHPAAFPDRQLLFVPLSIACSATCAALLAVASVLRTAELLSRCAVSVVADLAQQASLYARASAGISNGRYGSPVPLPELPLPEPAPAVAAPPEAYAWEIEPTTIEQQDNGGQPAATALAPRDRDFEHDSARGRGDPDGDPTSQRGREGAAQRRELDQPPAQGRWWRIRQRPQWLRNARVGSPDHDNARRAD
jgi:hypothetical protein